jgi:hypothetical protein
MMLAMIILGNTTFVLVAPYTLNHDGIGAHALRGSMYS